MAVRAWLQFAVSLCLAVGGATSEVPQPRPDEQCDADFPCKAVVNICPNVTAIPNRAFFLCTELTEVRIPSSVTTIGDMAFSTCYSLTAVKIPSSVTSIGRQAFYAAGSLTEVAIPDSVIEIGEYAFQSCANLMDVTLPRSLATIAHGAFDRCASLSSINVPASVLAIDEAAFASCTSLRSVLMLPGLERIGRRAFSNCTALQKVIVPSSVESIGDHAFEACNALAQATIEMPIPDMGDAAFPDWIDISYHRPLDAELSDEGEDDEDDTLREEVDHIIMADEAEGPAEKSGVEADGHHEEVDSNIFVAGKSGWQGTLLSIACGLAVAFLVVAFIWRQRQFQQTAAPAEGALSGGAAEDHDMLLAGAV